MKVWVLTSEYNEYDQHGAYFEAVYQEKPSIGDLLNQGVPERDIDKLLRTGSSEPEPFRDKWKWFLLEEVKCEDTK